MKIQNKIHSEKIKQNKTEIIKLTTLKNDVKKFILNE